jgi:PAS domain S-box-containing protein
MTAFQPEPLSILVVDDDDQILKTVSDILRLRGYNPEASSTAQRALEVAGRAGPPAIAIIDLRLPDMDGIELVTRLRSMSELTEVVILTGNATTESAIRALREHSYDYLVKPVEPDQLLESIGRAGERWQRRRAEAAMRQSEDRLRKVFEATADALIVSNDSGQIVDANRAAGELSGMSTADLCTRNLTEFLMPKAGPRPPSADGQAPMSSGEMRFRRADQAVRVVDVRGASFAPGLYVHAIRDLSAQRQLEEELRHSQKMDAIGRLAGGVAHDFNNMLTAIGCYSELLMSSLDKQDVRREDVDEIMKASRRAAALTSQLLAFSRKQILQPRIMDLTEVTGEIQRLLERLIGEDIELISRCESGVWPVRADPDQIGQVLLNLSVNSRDAMPNGGTLTIETSNLTLTQPRAIAHDVVAPGEYVVLRVSDTGVGIPAEAEQHVFDPFFTTKAAGKGTGLGLSTVYGIVKQSGGYIELQSTLGVGTTFSIYLPRAEAVSARLAQSDERAIERAAPATILLVEDDATLRKLVERILRREGHEVLAAAHGADAVRMSELREGHVDLLITDVVMPGMNGREVVERLRASRPEIGVLYMSGYTDDAVIVRGVSDLQDSLLQKPFTSADLIRKVSEVLAARPVRRPGAGRIAV